MWNKFHTERIKRNPMTQGWLCGSEVKALATKSDKLSWILRIHEERTDSHRLSSVLHHAMHIQGHVHIPVHIHTYSIHVYTYTHTRTFLNLRISRLEISLFCFVLRESHTAKAGLR